MKQIIWTPFSQYSTLCMGQKWHCLHFWIFFEMSRIGGKTKWLWVLGPSGSGTLLSLVWIGWQIQCIIWGSFWIYDLLLKEQVAVVAKRTFVQLYIAQQFHPFLDHEAAHSYSCPGHLPNGLLQCVPCGAPLKSIVRLQWMQNITAQVVSMPLGGHTSHFCSVCYMGYQFASGAIQGAGLDLSSPI